jgi:hypothetical protein
MISQRSFHSIVSVLTILFFCCFVLVSLVEANGNTVVQTELDARSAIVDTEQKIAACYEVAADADSIGANISTLLITLNEAGDLLSKAKLAYNIADFDAALSYGLSAQRKLDGFVAEADILKETAFRQNYLDFAVNVVGSIIGTAAVICGSLIILVISRKKAQKLEA